MSVANTKKAQGTKSTKTKQTTAAKKAGSVKKPSEKKPAAKKPVGDSDTVVLDRRAKSDRRSSPERRAKQEPVAAERRQAERRTKVNRRRQIDPTTCERDYSVEEVEFMNALDKYKRTSGRMFPTCSEILEVVKGLGYAKQLDEPEASPADTSAELSAEVPDESSTDEPVAPIAPDALSDETAQPPVSQTAV